MQGSRLTVDEIKLFSRYQFGGVVLFDRNADISGDPATLIKELAQISRPPQIVAVDFEGGRVRRLKTALGELGAPAEYSENFAKMKDDIAAVATAMRKTRINLNLAPVADIAYKPLNPALAGRTFSSDPSETAEYCQRFIETFLSFGIESCLKHFPGLGSAVNDPHLQVAVSCLPFERLRDYDFIPFMHGIKSGARFMMTTHLLMTAIDDKLATFSPRTCALARELGFDGVLLTDDLSMGAVRNLMPLEELVLESLCAGHDMALICHDHPQYPKVVKYLEKNMDKLEKSGHEKALQRISQITNSLPAGVAE